VVAGITTSDNWHTSNGSQHVAPNSHIQQSTTTTHTATQQSTKHHHHATAIFSEFEGWSTLQEMDGAVNIETRLSFPWPFVVTSKK
jgi:hypothetical protein